MAAPIPEEVVKAVGVVLLMVVATLFLRNPTPRQAWWHDLVDLLTDDTDRILDGLERDLGRDELVAFERRTVLAILDRRWRDHLYELDTLRDAVPWRASAGRDPSVEFTAGATHRFDHMSKDIEAEVARAVLAGPPQGMQLRIGF